jgi:hypothetical protein
MPVEIGRLVAVGIQMHLAAAPTDGLDLGRRQQPLTKTRAPQIFAHPKRLHEPGLSPRPAVQTCHNLAGLVPN